MMWNLYTVEQIAGDMFYIERHKQNGMPEESVLILVNLCGRIADELGELVFSIENGHKRIISAPETREFYSQDKPGAAFRKINQAEQKSVDELIKSALNSHADKELLLEIYENKTDARKYFTCIQTRHPEISALVIKNRADYYAAYAQVLLALKSRSQDQ